MNYINKFLRYFFIIFSLSLVGCASTQKSNFKDISAAYREVAEQYANDNILLNIIRASKDMPMSFLDIPSIVGSGSYTATAGITAGASYTTSQSPIVPSAGILPSNTTTYGGSLGMSVNNTFTFTQSSLDNAHFMGKFMEDVPPETIRFYRTQQNLPRAAMLLLLVNHIEIRTIDNEEIAWWVNNPRSDDYESFQKFLDLLIEVGLTVEPYTSKQAFGPPFNEKQFFSSSFNFSDLLNAKDGQGITLEKITLKGSPHYQLYKTKTQTRFCINKFKAEKIFGNKIGSSSYCEDSPKTNEKLSPSSYSELVTKLLKERNPNNKELVLRIKLRSIANVFDFLGNILIAENQNPPKPVIVTSKDISTFKPNYDGQSLSFPLFRIYKNGDMSDAISKVTYQSNVYYIKDSDQSYTKAVIEFLSTMLTLSKQMNSLPPSPTILVR
ncbi:MAG: hypothetical protein RLY18_779 [Pseudomonadota bacterium]|jgi:hypothetical protein